MNGGWVIKQHAIERYAERIEPGADFGRARAAIERAASSAALLSGRTVRGDERWRGGGDGKAPPVVLVVEAGTRNVVTVVKDTEANMQLQKSWGELLVIEMTKEGMSAADLAKRCGVEVRAVEAWRANERAPSGSALPRLYSVLRTMRHYGVHLAALRQKLRAEGDDGVVEVDEPTVKMAGPIEPASAPVVEPRRLVQVERDPRPVAVAAEEPLHDDRGMTYGASLRAARMRQGLTMHDLGELLGTSKDVVKNIERDASYVGAERLRKIVDLFPEMANLKPTPTPKASEPMMPTQAETSTPEKPKRRWRTFGQALRDLRVELGQDQVSFAKSAGVGPSSMPGWEADKAAPNHGALEKLHAYLPGLSAAPEPRRRSPGPKPGTPRRPRLVEAPTPADKTEAQAHQEALAKAAAMTPAEMFQCSVKAGVHNPDGTLTAPYADEAPPSPKAEASPLRRWLACVKAVRGAAYRAELVEMLRLAGEAGLGLDDVVDAVALVAKPIRYVRMAKEAGEMAKIDDIRAKWAERRGLGPYRDWLEAEEIDALVGEVERLGALVQQTHGVHVDWVADGVRLKAEVERLTRELAEAETVIREREAEIEALEPEPPPGPRKFA